MYRGDSSARSHGGSSADGYVGLLCELREYCLAMLCFVGASEVIRYK